MIPRGERLPVRRKRTEETRLFPRGVDMGTLEGRMVSCVSGRAVKTEIWLRGNR